MAWQLPQIALAVKQSASEPITLGINKHRAQWGLLSFGWGAEGRNPQSQVWKPAFESDPHPQRSRKGPHQPEGRLPSNKSAGSCEA